MSRAARLSPGALLLATFVGCSGPGTRDRGTPPPVDRAASAAPRDAAASAPLPSFEVLDARRAADATGMREALRVEPGAATSELRPTADTCYRAILAGPPGTLGRFVDAVGARGEPGADLVPPRGPVCARRGETLRFVIDGGAARALVWQSP